MEIRAPLPLRARSLARSHSTCCGDHIQDRIQVECQQFPSALGGVHKLQFHSAHGCRRVKEDKEAQSSSINGVHFCEIEHYEAFPDCVSDAIPECASVLASIRLMQRNTGISPLFRTVTLSMISPSLRIAFCSNRL